MTDPKGINAKNKTVIIIAMLSLAALMAMFMAWRVADSEEARERLIWQNRLSVVLNGRGDVVSKWIAEQKKIIGNLSENKSLQLYFSNLSGDMGLEDAAQDALKEYLLPLLSDRAEQNGYVARIDEPTFEIRANVDKPKHAGLALTNPSGQVIVATAGMPSVLNAVTAYLASGANKDTFMTGPYSGESGLPTISVITPVFGIDDDANSPALGFLVGIRLLDNEFFDLLNQPGEISLSARNYLVKKSGGMIEYIQNSRSLGSNYQPSLDATTSSLAANFAYENPGRMAEMMNYLGEPVIVSGTKIAGSDWVMIRTIGTEEALGGANDRKRNILIISLLIIISLGVLLVLIWRHSISVRLESAMNKQKALAKKHENLSEFMSIVTNSQPTEISAVDEKGNYTFVNLQAAISAGSKPEDMIGKSLAAVLGRAKVRSDEAYCEEVLASHKSKTDTRNIGTDDNPLIYKNRLFTNAHRG